MLWFGTARLLEDRFLELLARHPAATRLAIHLDGLGRITGALALKTLADDAARAGLSVSIDGVAPHAQPLMGRVLPEAVATEDREHEQE